MTIDRFDHPHAPNLSYARGRISIRPGGGSEISVRPGNWAASGRDCRTLENPKSESWNGPFQAGLKVRIHLPPAGSPVQTSLPDRPHPARWSRSRNLLTIQGAPRCEYCAQIRPKPVKSVLTWRHPSIGC
jgi:hypothetical protein